MALDTTFARGKPTGVYTSAAYPVGVRATKPTPVTLTVEASASAGATTVSLSVASGTVTLQENQILVFNEGDPDEVKCVVTTTTEVTTSNTSVPVDAVEGQTGDGIPGALAENDTAVWDRLYRVLGTSRSPLSLTENTSQLTSITYDSAQAMTWDEMEINSKGWTLGREGRFKAHDPGYIETETAAYEGREVWVQRILPDEQGAPTRLTEGRAIVTNFQDDPPADGIIDASWTWQGQGKPSRATLPVAP